MENPGVVTLADLNHTEHMKFPYRFCVEDNIGEAIHIHYKDIRLDLTVAEFSALAEQVSEIVDGIVRAEGFHAKDFDPVFLVGISPRLSDLEKVETREVFLEDILCDTFDDDGKPCMRSIKHSRVFKALCGLTTENDEHSVQFNYLKVTTAEKMSNYERLLYDLEQVKKFGYPQGNDLITFFNDENIIRDGQHRAACLYYLYGNIKVPARTLLFSELEKDNYEVFENEWENFERELYESAKKADERRVVSSLFFDTGEGFKEEQKQNCINTFFEDKIHKVRFNLEAIKNIRALRFDPIEGNFVKTKILSVKCDNDSFTFTAACCQHTADGFDLFYTTDPQYFGSVEGNISFVEIEFELEIATEFDVQCAVYGLNENKNELVTLTENLSHDIDELNGKCNWYESSLKEKDSAIGDLNNRCVGYENALSEKDSAINDLSAKCSWYESTLKEKDSAIGDLKKQLRSMYNSHSWKLTRPLRKVMKLFRRAK